MSTLCLCATRGVQEAAGGDAVRQQVHELTQVEQRTAQKGTTSMAFYSQTLFIIESIVKQHSCGETPNIPIKLQFRLLKFQINCLPSLKLHVVAAV